MVKLWGYSYLPEHGGYRSGENDRGALSGCQRLQSAGPRPILGALGSFHLSVMEVVMSSLPLLFKKDGLIEKHQVEGVDPSDRYFNRTVLVNRTPSGYAAKVMYEALTVEGTRIYHNRRGKRTHRSDAGIRLHQIENPRQFQRHEVSRRKRNLARYQD